MTDRENKPAEVWIDEMFAQARDAAQVPSEDLLERVLVDAYQAQDSRAASIPMPDVAVPSPPSAWRRALEAIAGWRGVAGLATAGVAGLAIGLGAPVGIGELWTGESAVAVDEATEYALDDLVTRFYDLGVEG